MNETQFYEALESLLIEYGLPEEARGRIAHITVDAMHCQVCWIPFEPDPPESLHFFVINLYTTPKGEDR